MQLVADDAVTEALESDNLALQNMSGSKYVQVGFKTLSAKDMPHFFLCPRCLIYNMYK